MHRVLLAAAASIVAATSPAAAQSFVASGFNAMSGTHAFGIVAPGFPSDPGRISYVSRHHRHIHRGEGLALGWGYDDEWARYNNRSWEADSYNDWWHERPDRAFPRWMSRNQDCARPWYSGDVLTC